MAALAATGKRLHGSPHLETWDEFEHRTHDNPNSALDELGCRR